MTVTRGFSTAVSAAAASAATGGQVLLSFTPATAALGGLLLGVATAGKLVSTGRVLDVSGAVKGLVTADAPTWRFAFLMGLSLGAVLLTAILPTAFETIPATFPVWRAALAGLLVGVGASMGNGCTSGHGICGSARLSTRSFAYTGSFMAAGMATATLTSTAAALNTAPLPAALAMPTMVEMQLAAAVAAVGIATYVALAAAARTVRSRGSADPAAGASASPAQQSGVLGALEMSSELVTGVIFALGLGLSGMTKPSKVAGFLSVGAPMWDLSLPFVMGGAVLVAMVAYQGVQRFRVMEKPLFCSRFQIPTSAVIDPRLLLGGLIFGAGWGLAGMCPGPAIVSAIQGDVHVLSYVAAMAGGMWLENRVSAWAAKAKQS